MLLASLLAGLLASLLGQELELQASPRHKACEVAQSANSRRGGSFLRQLSMQAMADKYANSTGGNDADGAGTGLETVMWTRELAKRLLLPRADVEGLEDLLDTYFMLVRSDLTYDRLKLGHSVSVAAGEPARSSWPIIDRPALPVWCLCGIFLMSPRRHSRDHILRMRTWAVLVSINACCRRTRC